MGGEGRRKKILLILREEKTPVSGTELARRVGVSRQVVVQDIALLRAENKEIMSTNKGYVLYQPSKESGMSFIRVFCTSHENEDTLDELQTIVDFGGRVLNVSVDHELYGQISVDLIINNRLDAVEFVNRMRHSKDLLLKVLTRNCHYHTVVADSEKNLDLIERELRRKGYIR